MALRTPPSWLQNGSHSAENDRLTNQSVWKSTGIINTGDLAISQNGTPNMTVNAASGWAAILGNYQTNMGVYMAYNDATTNLTITTANATNPRIDLVCITVSDAYYTGSVNTGAFNVVAGTPAASPTVPATPTNSIALAQIAVGAGVTSILTANITNYGVKASSPTVGNIVTAKGDIVTATASGTPSNLPVGSDGQTLVANSSQTTGLAYTNNFAAGKNVIINGDFRVWQRGTSFTNPASLAYTTDRFNVYWDGTGATRTISQQTFTPGTAPVAGYEGAYFYRYAQSVAGSSNTVNLLIQPIEDVRVFAGQSAVLSFWAKADASRSITAAVNQNFGSGGSGAVSTTMTGTASVTTSWQRFTFTVAVPSISGKTIGTSSSLDLRIALPSGVTQTIDIWGVQLEAGSVATAFQTATGTLQGELAACRRYLPAFNGTGEDFMGYAYASNGGIYTLPFDVVARTAPTGITVSGTIQAFALNTATTVTPTFNAGGINAATVLAAPTITAGQGSRLFLSTNGLILFTGCEL